MCSSWTAKGGFDGGKGGGGTTMATPLLLNLVLPVCDDIGGCCGGDGRATGHGTEGEVARMLKCCHELIEDSRQPQRRRYGQVPPRRREPAGYRASSHQ